MVTDYKEFKKKFQDPKLSNDEIFLVEKTEKYIYDEILNKMKSSEESFFIDSGILYFRYIVEDKTAKYLNLGRDRELILNKELISKFNKNNWQIKEDTESLGYYISGIDK